MLAFAATLVRSEVEAFYSGLFGKARDGPGSRVNNSDQINGSYWQARKDLRCQLPAQVKIRVTAGRYQGRDRRDGLFFQRGCQREIQVILVPTLLYYHLRSRSEQAKEGLEEVFFGY